MIKSIAVFCGAGLGVNPIYKDVAIELGLYLANNNIQLIYGGGNIGLMGVIADAVIGANGEAIGVIPDFLLQREVGHKGLSELIVVDTMHQRKQKMCELADAFITMPGGFGSMDELFEILTWKQLALHNKPVGILNVNGYYDFLLQHINFMNKEQFVSDHNMKLIVESDSITKLFCKMI